MAGLPLSACRSTKKKKRNSWMDWTDLGKIMHRHFLLKSIKRIKVWLKSGNKHQKLYKKKKKA
jgi:hypothetical protein